MSNYIDYIGCDDAELDLFESQYELPEGMCYNSYVVRGEQIAVMDSVDARKTDEWLNRLSASLGDARPDYMVVQHVEPDHSGSLGALLRRYPEVTVVASAKAMQLMQQFGIAPQHSQVVKEGDVLDLGGCTLRFVAAPMVHWPEVFFTYCAEAHTLFSADAFGKFGVYGADADDWACEARRYYFNICGKYGMQVQAALRKVSGLDIRTIAPLHGQVLEGEQLAEALRLYAVWSSYEPETEGVLVAYASIHGNTRRAAEQLADILRAKGAGKVAVTDLTRDDMAEAIEDAFRMSRMVICASSYDADIFPAMHLFLWKLGMKGYRNRRVAIVENGSWAPSAGRVARAMLEPMKEVTIVEPMVTIRGSLKPEDVPALETLADTLLAPSPIE
ncbi:MAG: FprA family A-type flavoprotein [Paludibacteraceae bacterium]|nr:FprA family A-type flavoprotein [Paludibacteraceae bacterium]